MKESYKHQTLRHKPPSRIRYERENPPLSIRMPKEYREKVKSYGIRRCGSLSKYLKRCVNMEQALVVMSIETLRKFFNLSSDVVNKLYTLCKLELNRVRVAKSFADLGFNYAVQIGSGMKLNAAICLAYLFLCRYGGLSVEELALIIKDSLNKARRRIPVAESQLLRIFYKALASQAHIRSKWRFMLTDIMAMIVWILIHSGHLKTLALTQKAGNRRLTSVNETDLKTLEERLRKIADELKKIGREARKSYKVP